MRTAALALACYLGAAATAIAADATAPGYVLPPFPDAAPPAASSMPSSNVRAYAPARGRSETPRPPHGRVCYSQAETREKIAQRRLTDPVSATAAGRAQGDALRTRLCRWKQDELVYEVYVLRHDGRVVRLYIDAQNGHAIDAADAATDHK